MRDDIVFHSDFNSKSEVVDFCSLVAKTAKYRDHPIRLIAVLVEKNNRMLIDGADSFLYDPSCVNEKVRIVVRWSTPSKDISAANSLQSIRSKSDEFGVSRAKVALIGTLSAPRKQKFGHLGWADLEFNIDDVEKAEPVADNLQWPKWVEDAYRKARTKP